MNNKTKTNCFSLFLTMNKEENSHDQLQRDELSGTELEEMWHNIHESVTDGKQR